MTRQQLMLNRAIDRVNDVAGQGTGVSNAYKSLSHKFPVLIRTCGLCQTSAFVDAKAGGRDDLAQAHALLQKHALQTLEDEGFDLGNQQPSSLGGAIRGLVLTDYVLATKLLLNSWVYYKRFAESLLPDSGGG